MTGFHMQAEDRTVKQMNDQPSGNLPFLKPDDIQYFDKLLVRNASWYQITERLQAGLFCLTSAFLFVAVCLGRGG